MPSLISSTIIREIESSCVNYTYATTPSKSGSAKVEVKRVEIVEKLGDLGHFPLSFREEYELAKRAIAAMNKMERIELARQAFGMWAEDDEDWKYSSSIDLGSIIDIQSTSSIYHDAVYS